MLHRRSSVSAPRSPRRRLIVAIGVGDPDKSEFIATTDGLKWDIVEKPPP